MCFVDDATRRGKSYGMQRKDQVLEMWQKFLEEELIARGKSCKYLRSDNGGEYCSAEMDAFNNCRGIQSERSPPFCQSGDGVSEVYWRDTFRMVRTIIWDQQRDHSWWLAALNFADHIRNHLATTALEDTVPEVAFTGKPVDVSHFRVPLATCWSYVEKTNRDGTISARRIKCIFAGYNRQSPSYDVWDTDSGTVYTRRHRDVVFDESQHCDSGKDPEVAFVDSFLASLEIEIEKNRAEAQKQGGGSKPIPGLAGFTGFVRTTKDHTVQSLANLFKKTPEQYLADMKQHGDWYLNLEGPKSVVAKGSDVPVPKVMEALRNQKAQGMAQKRKVSEVSVSKGVRRSIRNRKQQEMIQALMAKEVEVEALCAGVAMQERMSEKFGVAESNAAFSVHIIPGTESNEGAGKPPKGYKQALENPAWR